MKLTNAYINHLFWKVKMILTVIEKADYSQNNRSQRAQFSKNLEISKGWIMKYPERRPKYDFHQLHENGQFECLA